jgi:Phospholipase A2-like domain
LLGSGIGVSIGIGPPGLNPFQKRLLPDQGGIGAGGDVVEFYGGQNGGGIMLVGAHTVPGYNYCGPGNLGGAPTNGTDACCKFHDQCYGSSFSGIDVLEHPFGIAELPRQLICDRVLCGCVGSTPAAGLKDFMVQQGASALFCH